MTSADPNGRLPEPDAAPDEGAAGVFGLVHPDWTLADWLVHVERLHPVGIDMTLARTREVAQRLGLRFGVPVVMVAGTNGKGSTCAMLEAIALRSGYRVGLYSKPHLVHFEERCRLNGQMVEPAALLPHFQAVEAVRADITLTYFEFTTLAIMRLLSQAALDLVILEVGLGGRLDAVNIVDADVSVITSIDLDHTEYLGPDRESIGREKAHIMRSGRAAVVSDPLPPSSVLAHAQSVGADLWLAGRDFAHGGDRQQWHWKGRARRYHALSYPALRGANQLINASGVLAAFEALADRLPITAQAVREGLALVELPGRFQIVPGQPVLVLDVAHNPHAVATLAVNLDQMGFYPRTFAVFGAMRDKDLAQVVHPLLPLVSQWHVCGLPTPRAATGQELREVLQRAGAGDSSVVGHDTPAKALQAALCAADPADRILVFGSFWTVGGVIAQGLPKLGSAHGR
ncbi:MAG: bifunctional tetrahydrofolate synthase/dihydrofolate synthase [Betaproteobacteria bacterium]|nr:bifunctional tetrahydrofolate synthase/dihydrofolate synthase [Betaproteobacteria bacterium]